MINLYYGTLTEKIQFKNVVLQIVFYNFKFTNLNFPVKTFIIIGISVRTKKPASFHYIDTCFMYNIGGVSDRPSHDSLSL